jgi:hypothetical protein
MLPLIATGISLLGGMMQKKSEKKAAAGMNPWGVDGLFGNVAFDPSSQRAFINADRHQTDIRNLLGGNAAHLLSGGGNSGFLNFAQGLGNEQLPALFGQYQDALGGLPSDAFSQYQSQMGQAQGIANQDLQGLMGQKLQLLRDQAAPQEQAAFNSLQNNLFSTGRMGTSGGGMMMERFARGLGQADTERQLAAQQLGIQAQNQNLQQAGLLSELAGTGFANALNYNDIGVNRAAQRMQNAMGLFGFGNDLTSSMQTQGLAGLQGMLGIDSNLMNAAALGKNLAASAQQAQMASGSPLGGLLTGIGGGMMQNVDWSNVFKKSPAPTTGGMP